MTGKESRRLRLGSERLEKMHSYMSSSDTAMVEAVPGDNVEEAEVVVPLLLNLGLAEQTVQGLTVDGLTREPKSTEEQQDVKDIPARRTRSLVSFTKTLLYDSIAMDELPSEIEDEWKSDMPAKDDPKSIAMQLPLVIISDTDSTGFRL